MADGHAPKHHDSKNSTDAAGESVDVSEASPVGAAEEPRPANLSWRDLLPERLAAFLVAHPWRVHLAVFLLMAIAGITIFLGVRFNSDVLDLFPAHFDSVRVWKISNREFAQGRALTFALHDPTGVVDLEEFAGYFATEIRKEPWVVRAMDQLPLGGSGDDASMVEGQTLLLPILLNRPPAEFAATMEELRPEAVRKRLGDSLEKLRAGSMKEDFMLSVDPLGVLTPAFRQLGASGAEQTFSLASPDGTTQIVPVITRQEDLGAHTSQELMKQVEDFRQRVLAGWDGPKPEVLVTGRTAYVGELSQMMRTDVLSTLLTSALLVSAVFWLGFRRVRPLLAILHVLLVSCVIAVGLGALVFHELNMITIGLCSILIGLGVDFGMMLYATYEIERNAGQTRQAAIAGSLQAQGPSVIFGAVTSAAGFFSHVFSGCPGFEQLGLLICFGILVASGLMMTLFFVSISGKHRPCASDPLRAWGEKFVGWVARSPRRVWLPTGLALLGCMAFAVSPILPLHFDANPRTLEPPGSAAGHALRLITDKFPGLGDQLMVLLETRTAQETHDGWLRLQAAWSKLVEEGKIRSVSILAGALVPSPVNIEANLQVLAKSVDLAATRAALAQTLSEAGAAPMPNANALLESLTALAAGDRSVLAWRERLPENSTWWFLIDQFFGADPQITAGYVRTVEPITSREQKEILRNHLTKATEDVPYHLSGWNYTLQDLVHWAKGKMVELSAIMIAFNVVLLGLLYRRVFPVAILLLGLVLAFGAMLASLKVFGIALNLFNVLAFPLILGIGVDYGIYIVVALRPRNGGEQSVGRVMKPVLLSALTTAAGFASLALANNPALQGLGIVVSLGVVWCLFTTFFFILPACMWHRAR